MLMVFSNTPISWEMAGQGLHGQVLHQHHIRKVRSESFWPARTLSARMSLNLLHGEQHHMRRSGDFDAEQATQVMLAEQPGHGIEVFRIPLWNRKSLTFSSVSVAPLKIQNYLPPFL